MSKQFKAKHSHWSHDKILPVEKRERRHRGWARRPPGAPRGGVSGSIWFNLAQFTSIYLNLVRDGLDFRHLVEPGEGVPGQWAFWRRRFSCRGMGQRAADGSAVARPRGPRKRCLVSMRGNDSKNESRIKSYGRFLDRFIPPKGRKALRAQRFLELAKVLWQVGPPGHPLP